MDGLIRGECIDIGLMVYGRWMCLTFCFFVMVRSRNVVEFVRGSTFHVREPNVFNFCLKWFHDSFWFIGRPSSCSSCSHTPNISSIKRL